MTTRAGSARTNIYSLVDGSNVVQNLCVWDGVTTFVPTGLTPVQALTDVKILDTYIASVFESTVDSK